MRELEFRAWDKKSKKFRVVSSIVYDTTSRHSIEPKIKLVQLWGQPFCDDGERNPDVLCMRNPNEVVIQQYTGLKDKNGVKIFEGDIVSLLCNKRNSMESWDVTRLAIIKNEPPAFYFKVIGDADNVYIPSMLDVTFIEVIGNIHQNQELLSEVK